MPRKPQPTPHHYAVQLATPLGTGEEHHAILFLRPAMDSWVAAEAGYSFGDIIDAYQSWMDAATAAAVVLARDLDDAARQHRCRPSRSGGYEIDVCSFDASELEKPGLGLTGGWQPSVSFAFPAKEAKAWRKRILETVEQIRAARAWRPTAQEEAALMEYWEIPGHTTPTITSLLPERPATLTARQG